MLSCLAGQPFLLLANAQSAENIVKEHLISDALGSPHRENIRQAGPYWLENYCHFNLNQTPEEMWANRAQVTLTNLMLCGARKSLPPSPRLELLKELQLLNAPTKKSIFKAIDRTQTHGGKISLFTGL